MGMENREELEKLRHSAAHLLAAAVVSLWKEALPTLGPAIENGFYYDFDMGEVKIGEEDLPKIEEEMRKLVKGWAGFERMEKTADEAREHFKNNPYKLELIDEIVSENEAITFYKSGGFIDLCRGRHVEKPNEALLHFKLTEIAGAYWRGSEKNKMLTRIYGTAFFGADELGDYLNKLEEAKNNNHRKLGKELELFAIFPEIGQGLPVWLPAGYASRRALEDYMISLERDYGYEHILTPHINREELFKISGHLGFYNESMYNPLEIEDEKFYLKPMNCPGAMMVYGMKPRSYRELPIKMGELGTVYRFEKSGELHGLQRVRGFTQNDAHIFCTKEQLVGQIDEVMEMMSRFYSDIGFDNYRYILATSDPDDDKFKACGTREGWEWAEGVLRNELKNKEVEFEEIKGDAAFYGPKIDVVAVNVFGKQDAISTVQVDFNLPARFGLSYINKEGIKEEPVVVHRALVGSFERFFAFLIEYFGGAFPLWFAPIQAIILPISENEIERGNEIVKRIKECGIRCEADKRNETLQAKIRDAQLKKIPYMVIVGKNEVSDGNISVRKRNGEEKRGIGLEDFIEEVNSKITKRDKNL